MADQISQSRNSGRRILSRLLLSAIGLVVGVAQGQIAMAQGSCGGARAGTPACDTTPAKLPFPSTGWKTVALDHFTMHAVDYKKEAAYYMALMNWKLRSDDGKQAVLDIGDIGSVVIVGGYTPPRTPVVSATGGGGGGGGGRGPAQVAWDSFSWAISPWDRTQVEAELKKRGLKPIADTGGGPGCESFHIQDPNGFDLQVSNGCFAKARQSEPTKAVPNWTQAAPFASTNWKTAWLDHISLQVSDYKGEVAFYQALLGWQPTGDEGSQNEVWMCDDCGNSIIRGGNALSPTYDQTAPHRATIGHVSVGISQFDADGTLAELTRRGLNSRPDTGGRGDIHDPAALYKSYHTTTPLGFDLQLSNATKQTRTVR